ncbi:MAG: GDSL-type esterase/lipase family protein [Clostridia bacterium]|nr:GDSL-type esterase/lipase family protein [Clostridia bacterium]
MKKMKKVWGIILLIICLFAVSTVFAQSSPTAIKSNISSLVKISGKVDAKDAGEPITVLLVNPQNSEIGYIEQIRAESDGSYNLIFTFKQDIAPYSLTVNQAGEVINDTVTVASAVSECVSVDLDVDYSSSNFLLDGAKIDAIITNDMLLKGDYRLIIAGYDADGRLVKTVSTERTELLAGQNKNSINISDSNIVKIKAYVWFNNMIPMCENTDKKELDVAFVGDSITHRSEYIKVIETYYRTRYPDYKINFVNKGINAHSFATTNSRFYWDIVNNQGEEMNNKPDALTVMLGANDSSYGNYANMTQEQKDSNYNSYIANAEKFIKLCLSENIDLTIITPVLMDEDPDYSDRAPVVGINDHLGRFSEGLKELGEKYNVPVIDMHSESLRISNDVRENYPDVKNVIMGIDRVHPDSNGGFVMGYIFIKESGHSPIVSSTAIDVNDSTSNQFDNADVIMHEVSENGVSYSYLPKALPYPYCTEYQYAEDTLHLPVTEDINKEIIKISGLKEGSYNIIIDDNLLGTYTSEDLSKGVNIAVNQNNPSQIQAQEVYDLSMQKARMEFSYRYIAQTHGGILSGYYNGATDYDGVVEYMKNRYGDSYNDQMRYINIYFGVEDSRNSQYDTTYGAKANQQSTWNSIQQLQDQAVEKGQPKQHEVVITRAQ